MWMDPRGSHLAAAASTCGVVHLIVPSSWWAYEVAVTLCPQAKCSVAVWPGRWPGLWCLQETVTLFHNSAGPCGSL